MYILDFKMKRLNEKDDLKNFLDKKVAQFNNPSFIKDDPILFLISLQKNKI